MQFDEIDLERGANTVSLRQSQKNFIKFGACEISMLRYVRKPNIYDVRDENWKFISRIT